jgi:outer membrane protein assembly factor BamB
MKVRAIFSNSGFVVVIAVFCIIAAVMTSSFVQGTSSDPAGRASEILEKAGIKGGFIVHLNCGDGVLTEALKAGDQYLVQGLDTSTANVQKARKYIASKREYGPVSIDRLTGNRLPYRDNMANLVVAENLGGISMDEVNRVLAPNGVAMILSNSEWGKTVKPKPKGMDEWNQYLYNEEGTMVSNDELVGPVKDYQWIGSPKWGRHHDTTASMSALVSANGRIFYVMDEGPTESIQLPSENFLVARDAYNGTILWKLPITEWQNHLFSLKSGPAYLPRRLVAIGDRVYVTLGINAPLSELDAATGKTLRTFPKTDQTSEIVYSDGTLFLVVGRPEKSKETYAPTKTGVWENADWARVTWGWGQETAQIMAIKASDGKALWTKPSPVAPLTLTADSKSVYFFDGEKIVSVDRSNGKEKWQSQGIKTQTIHTGYAPRIVVHDDVLLFSNEPRTARQRFMLAFSVSDGKKLWEAVQPASGHFSPEDMFVINDLVWTGSTANVQDNGLFTGRDIHTGEVEVELPADVSIYWFHQRCYPSKATKNYILTSRTGLEFIDLSKKHWTVNHYTRGGCIYGIMPSNGLIYTPPNACACYMEAKIGGFGALAPSGKSEPDLKAEAAKNRLEKGPAYNAKIADISGTGDWPTYRHDTQRSSFTKSPVPSKVQSQWKTKLGGKLSSPVVAGNRVYVAKVNAHTVYAIDANNGKELWNFMAGGRIDSPPTIYQGRVLFGSADGYVYCLNAQNGELIWRFLAAPMDRRMVAFEQVESVWPVHGSVLIQNDKVYCVAGRSMFLDGGMRLLQLNPRTGEKLSETILDEIDPETGKNLHAYVSGLNMPVGLPDILSSDGKYIYMRSQQFDLDGKRKQIAVRNVNDQTGEGAHIFSPVGFLDDTQFSRSYMMYGKSVSSGWGSWEVMGRLTPSGRVIAVDDQKVYGYARKPEFLSESIVLEYQLYAANKSSDQAAINRVNQPLMGGAKIAPKRQTGAAAKIQPAGEGYRPAAPKMQTGVAAKRQPAAKIGSPGMGTFRTTADWKLRQDLPKEDLSAVDFQWQMDKPEIQVRAMVLADKTLFIAGPPDIVDEEKVFFTLKDADVQRKLTEQTALLHGKDGARLWAVSAESGKKLTECKLDSLPVWDGMIACGGKLFMSTMNGEVVCLSN